MPSKSSLSKLAAWGLVAFPCVLALAFASPADFLSPGSILKVLGRLAGIWGLASMLVAVLLSCRVPGFDQPFGGLTKQWQLHHVVGSTGFIVLLIHPLLLSFSAAEVSLQAAVATLFSLRMPVLIGWAALLGLMFVMALVFYGPAKLDYQRWKRMHRFGILALLFALIHSLMLSFTLPVMLNELVWGSFGLLTLSVVVYSWIRSLFRQWGRYPYRISKVLHVSTTTVELSLEPLTTPLHFRPGQFVYLTPYATDLAVGTAEEHPFTLSSAPEEPVLRIAIKALGDASRAMQTIAVDTVVAVDGPYGHFLPARMPTGHSLWIAGGIGIVPFLCYLRHSAALHRGVNVHLIYCVQDENHMLFRDELYQLTSAIVGCCFVPHFFCKNGPLDLSFMTQNCPELRDMRVWICGPPQLISLSRSILQSAGVKSGHIATEEFNLL